MSAVTILHWMHPKRTQLLRANLESSISTMRSVRSVDTLFITNFRKFQFHSLGRHICTVPDRTPCLRRDSSASLREGAPQLMDYKQTMRALRSAYSIPSTAQCVLRTRFQDGFMGPNENRASQNYRCRLHFYSEQWRRNTRGQSRSWSASQQIKERTLTWNTKYFPQ